MVTTLLIVTVIGVGGPVGHRPGPLAHLWVEVGHQRERTDRHGRASFHVGPRKVAIHVIGLRGCKAGSIRSIQGSERSKVVCSIR
jgi:hypothetical protein